MPPFKQQHHNSVFLCFHSPVSVNHAEMELYSGGGSRKHPRDLFRSFSSMEGEGEIELNLGLSLGGRFGVDRSHNGLIRSFSIAGSTVNFTAAEPVAVAALARTASLPLETDEEWRRRKEMQSLRRAEAKRRRCEKQRSTRGNAAWEERRVGGPGKAGSGPGMAAMRQGSGGGFVGGLVLGGQGGSQGSGESQCGGSSGVSEFESKGRQGSGSCGEARSPASTLSTQERGSQDRSPIGSSTCTKYGEGSSKHRETSDHKKKEAAIGGIGDMPCVFTIGDGPNGRKVEGILYKYGKGEEVRIMCICHGSFYSPAEFVRHAGCRDVEHPLRHIVVNPSPSSF